MKFNLSQKQKFEIVKALGVDLMEVEKILQPTADSLIINFVDGHVATFNIYDRKKYLKKFQTA